MINFKFVYNYFTRKVDTDGSFYFSLNSDVKSYDRSIFLINELFDKYHKLIDIKHSLFVRGNYLCFTFRGVRYYTIFSWFLDEEHYMPDIVHELSCLGCEYVFYKHGDLD